MGIDFIRRAAKSFRKGIDRRRIELCTPGLFTKEPECGPRTYAANLSDGQLLSPGDTVGIRLDELGVTAMRGLDRVATLANPSSELITALSNSHGEASGHVHVVHLEARVAEISIC